MYTIDELHCPIDLVRFALVAGAVAAGFLGLIMLLKAASQGGRRFLRRR